MVIRTVKRFYDFFTIFAKPLLCGPGSARAKKSPWDRRTSGSPRGFLYKNLSLRICAGFISSGILPIKSHRINSMYSDIDVVAIDSTVVITGATWLK
jgi:hypothetical protein